MADITNQQLLSAMTDQLGIITDNMATKEELHENGVKLEEIESKLDTALEMVSDSKGTRNLVKDHEARIVSLEADDKAIKTTLRLHSSQINQQKDK